MNIGLFSWFSRPESEIRRLIYCHLEEAIDLLNSKTRIMSKS